MAFEKLNEVSQLRVLWNADFENRIRHSPSPIWVLKFEFDRTYFENQTKYRNRFFCYRWIQSADFDSISIFALNSTLPISKRLVWLCRKIEWDKIEVFWNVHLENSSSIFVRHRFGLLNQNLTSLNRENWSNLENPTQYRYMLNFGSPIVRKAIRILIRSQI